NVPRRAAPRPFQAPDARPGPFRESAAADRTATAPTAPPARNAGRCSPAAAQTIARPPAILRPALFLPPTKPRPNTARPRDRAAVLRARPRREQASTAAPAISPRR